VDEEERTDIGSVGSVAGLKTAMNWDSVTQTVPTQRGFVEGMVQHCQDDRTRPIKKGRR